MKQHNYHRRSSEDVQKDLPETTRSEYLQNGVSSSTDDYFPEKEDISSQIDLSRFPAGTRVVQVRPHVILDIPDSWFEEIQNSLLYKTVSMRGYLSEEHRKEQLAYLNGRLKKDGK